MRLLFSLIVIGLLCNPSIALSANIGKVENINVSGQQLLITHSNCQLREPKNSAQKLILVLANCAETQGILNDVSTLIKTIQWAAHENSTLWVVITWQQQAQPYQITSEINQFIIDFAIDEKNTLQANNALPPLLKVNDILLVIPLEKVDIQAFIEHSIGYLPKDVMRDGLPQFGSVRSDWEGSARKHLGYDIYFNHINVLAAANGKVNIVAGGQRAGLYVKLTHSDTVQTVYVHLSQIFVVEGQMVRQGQIIGRIDAAVGNAVEPQLHFELKIENESVDPLPYIKQFYAKNPYLIEQIAKYEAQFESLTQQRKKQVDEYLKNKALP